MKIIDSFIFYNELDMLTYRLSILNEFVDYFVLVESTHSFSGNLKELFYYNNKDLFKDFNHKIIHVVVDNLPFKKPNINISTNDQWINEAFQRNSIKSGIDIIDFSNEDIILTSDLDEITNPEILKKLKNNELQYNTNGLNRLALDMYYYNLNTLVGRQCWHGIKLFNFKTYKNLNLSFQEMRTYEWTNHVNIIENGGWHLSYFGDIKFIQNKIRNFSHQEFNNEVYNSESNIEQNVNNQTNIFDQNKQLINIPIKENNNLPPEYDKYLKKYYIA